MKFIIPIFILFFCFACNSPSKNQANTDNSVDSVAKVSSSEKEITVTTETKDEPIVVGKDEILFRGW